MHESRGCPSTATAATSTSTGTSSTQTPTQTTSSTTFTTTATRTATGTATKAHMRFLKKSTCGRSCIVKGFAANCSARMLWASEHITKHTADPRKAAHDLVASECDFCEDCKPQDAPMFAKAFEAGEAKQGGSPWSRTVLRELCHPVALLCRLGLLCALLVGWGMRRRRGRSLYERRMLIHIVRDEGCHDDSSMEGI